MDSHHFDRLTHSWTELPSRRDIWRGLAGMGLGGAIARQPDLADASQKRKRRRRMRRHKTAQPPQTRPLAERLDANCPAASGASHVANLPALTFVPRRSGLLTRARVLLFDSQAGQDFKLFLTRVDAAGLPIEVVLASEEVRDLPATGPGNAPQPLAATFADPAFVSKGTRYALVIVSEQGFQLALGQTGQCPDSLAYDDTNRDGVFTPFPDRDFAFETFVSGAV